MTKQIDETSFFIAPTRAILTMRGLVGLECEIEQGDMSAVMNILDRAEDVEVEHTFLPGTLFSDDEGWPAEMVMGDPAAQRGTFLTIEFEAPPEYAWCSFRLVVGEKQLMRIYREKRERLETLEAAAEGDEAGALIALVSAVFRFAAGEGGSPVAAFSEWLTTAGRKGCVGFPALPLAA